MQFFALYTNPVSLVTGTIRLPMVVLGFEPWIFCNFLEEILIATVKIPQGFLQSHAVHSF